MIDSEKAKCIIELMGRRGFEVVAHCNPDSNHSIIFASASAYDTSKIVTIRGHKVPPISILVDLQTDEFTLRYRAMTSLSRLEMGPMSPVTDDVFFNMKVNVFETEATWLARIRE